MGRAQGPHVDLEGRGPRPRRVDRLNVAGDAQADLVGHGGEHRAVYVYDSVLPLLGARSSAATDFVHGQFGENFTVEGLPDDEACIGDRYRIGGALFEVTQPRVTCYKVGIRMDEPRMPALLYSHGRPGFYLRVLEEGEVGAGDAIERVAVGPEAMTVREISALLYLPGHTRRELERALAIPALPQGWRGSFEALLEQTRRARRATVASRRRAAARPRGRGCGRSASPRSCARAARSASFALEPVDGEPLPASGPAST